MIMKRYEESHFTHYSLLLGGLGLLGVLFILFKHNSAIQILVGGFGCLFYIIWGIFHHAIEERVTKFIVIEYMSFGLLAFLLMVLFVII